MKVLSGFTGDFLNSQNFFSLEQPIVQFMDIFLPEIQFGEYVC